ncbi:FMN-dependent NADH-azoreductase [Bacillus thuringiensis]|uniref:FMN-dependent NADH-azoreductase n=1 Tax=Bacillus thuringiensis TaxID=1428 RepID=A0ABD6RYE4_BACTU|nr:YrrS family protein [Bacillus thuringiensis]PER43881.1 FMN-dependent NADH-azoreductase [Bacillus thuringiensis]PEU96412.1 FMN-dependent NADH-azoreductase [Bacillus thuringiensis]PFI03281.1 FMN-dependent NADH-azoreductase [Bacillus thuringiensis]PFW33218.1 FMN-dependent NADH-azoreductase [Bacillus thuringiensis]PGY75562.1 FMN-dependent NADH-azoreductase [Bacillus thuringiensis]
MGQVSRFQEKQQNRRQKAIFNIAFTLILVTVGIVTYQLFTASNTSKKAIAQEKKATKIEEKKTEDKETAKIEEKKTEDKETAQLEEKKTEDKEVAKIEEKKTEDKEAAQLEEKSKAEKSVKTNGNENNEEEKAASQEKGSQTNPSWKPIGTEQGAKPEMKFKEGTVDWSEMKKAISYAVDVPESQLIFDFIGNNGNNKAYGNVRDKQNNKKYKVNIDWVENQGWKPASVQVVR